ncbi:MAG: hypothetical protein HY832_03835 [Candidatus Aenigmarchaeota archaeon]|nr:hypothetical protein [Candidatus Aenigmarchaeota archaeon]
MDGTCLAKIHPGTPFSIVAGDGAVYHTYELLETPEHYSDSRHMAPDFVDLDREKGHVLMERQEKIIKIPGGLVFSDHGAWKKPGWMANEYCGSPEMRYFALRDCRSSRSGEVLHYHGYEMEPYIGLEGEVRLFVSVDDGYEMLAFRNREGVSETIRGEVVPIKSGDVVIPLPRVRHRILFEQMSYPISMDCINYSAHGLQNYSNNDRVVLEKL